MAKKAPCQRGDTAKAVTTAWVLFAVRQGSPEALGVCSSPEGAEHCAHTIITKVCGQALGRPPAWTKASTGGRVLIYGRDRHSFHFRAEPFLMDAEL